LLLESYSGLSAVTSEFNVVVSLIQGLGRPTKAGMTFTGAWEQFWSDALPAATDDSYGYQRQLNEGSLGASLSP